MLIAVITEEVPLTAEVFKDGAREDACVVVRCDNHGVWEALYAIHNGMQIELPACFNLGDDALRALCRAITKGT